MVIAALILAGILLSIWIGFTMLLYWSVAHDVMITPTTFDCCVNPAPKVSVIVPARNEDGNLSACLDSLLAQDYPDFEVIVVDDRSTDRTAEIIESYVKRDRRVCLIRNTELPEGWTGRNYALHLGARRAKGDFLLFTDADVTHVPTNLSQTVTYAVRNGVDMLGLALPLENKTFWQKMIQPVTCIMILLMYRLTKVNDPRSEKAYSNGQYLLIRRSAYEQVGGREAIRSETMDLVLAMRVKEAGLRLALAYAPDLSRAHSPGSFHDVWRSWSRILAGHSKHSLWAMSGLLLQLFFVDVMPYVVFLGACTALVLGNRGTLLWTLFVVSGATLVMLQWVIAVSYREIRSDTRFAVFHLPACILIAAMVIAGGWNVVSGRGFVWKGHRLRTPDASSSRNNAVKKSNADIRPES